MALSGAAPLQTAPKAVELEHDAQHLLAIRDALVAGEGFVCASVDYSLMELRLAAALSGDAALRAAVESGDALAAVARSLFNTTNPTAKQRAVAKTVNFGAMYGMREHTLAQRLGVSHVQAHAFLESWWARFPRLRTYADEVSDNDRTPWSRRLPVDVPHYAKLNHRIQGASRDVFAGSLLRLEDAGFDRFLLLPLHDEAVLRLPEHKAPELLAEIAELVHRELNGVPLPVDAHLGGPSWGSVK
jgi:DNA polymerase-1